MGIFFGERRYGVEDEVIRLRGLMGFCLVLVECGKVGNRGRVYVVVFKIVCFDFEFEL